MGPSNDDTIIDTNIPVLSHFTYREAHRVINGFYVGLVGLKDADAGGGREKHYWRIGFMAGWMLKATLIIVGYEHLLTTTVGVL